MTARRHFLRHALPMSLALAGLLAASAASAQLKMPGSGKSPAAPVTTAPAAPAVPAAAAASAPSPAAAAASENAEMEKAAELAAMGWLLLLDRRDWGTAWDTSAAMFRSSVPLSTWMEGIPKARAPLGQLVERKAVEAVHKRLLPGRPPGDYITLGFQSKFDQKPDAQEIVTTVREADGKWRVTGYSTR